VRRPDSCCGTSLPRPSSPSRWKPAASTPAATCFPRDAVVVPPDQVLSVSCRERHVHIVRGHGAAAITCAGIGLPRCRWPACT
jgi:hypothetical protein